MSQLYIKLARLIGVFLKNAVKIILVFVVAVAFGTGVLWLLIQVGLADETNKSALRYIFIGGLIAAYSYAMSLRDKAKDEAKKQPR